MRRQCHRREIDPGRSCEMGVEGSAPRRLPDGKPAVPVEVRDSGELPAFLKAVADLGATFFVCQFTPEQTTPEARRRAWIGTEGTAKEFRAFASACRNAGLDFYVNLKTAVHSPRRARRRRRGGKI